MIKRINRLLDPSIDLSCSTNYCTYYTIKIVDYNHLPTCFSVSVVGSGLGNSRITTKMG